MRDQVIDFVRELSERTEIPITRVLGWLPLSRSKYAEWKKRYGKANEHNGKVPRDFWLEEHERAAIIEFHNKIPLEGYRRLTFMMLDQHVVAADNGRPPALGPDGKAFMVRLAAAGASRLINEPPVSDSPQLGGRRRQRRE